MPGQGKTYADWMAGQVKGGALVRASGGIQSTKSTDQPSSSKAPRGLHDDPDLPQVEKPTDKDVKEYIKKKAKEVEKLNDADFDSLGIRSAMNKAGTDNLDAAYLSRGKQAEAELYARLAGGHSETQNLAQKIQKAKGASQKQKLEAEKTKLEQSIAEDMKLRDKLGSDDEIRAYGKQAVKADIQEIKQAITSAKSITEKSEIYAAIKSGGAPHSEVIGSYGRSRIVARSIKEAMTVSDEKILGLPKGELTPEAVRTAYRAAGLKAHPDKGGSKAAFERVSSAYQALKQKMDFSDEDDPTIVSLNEYAASIGLHFNFSEFNFAEIEIEILPKGMHTSSNGFKLPVSDRDLDDLVNSYDPKNFQAPLIISHDTKGIPDGEIGNSEFSFGIPKMLKRVGDRVKAVFDKVAPEFEQWVRDRKLVSVSPSFYLPNSPSNPSPGKLSLRHIAALGATPPAIKGMGSLQTAFNFEETIDGVMDFSFSLNPETLEFSGDDWILGNTLQRLREWLISEHDIETADRVIPSFEVGILLERRGFDPVLKRLAELEEKVFGCEPDNYPTYSAMQTDQELEFSERERQIADREAALLKKELISFCECELKGKLTPAIAPQEELIAFMSHLDTQTEVSFGEDKTASPLEWFKTFLTRLPKQVEFNEVATAPLTQTATPSNTADFNAEELEYDRQIRTYMQQHSVEYAEAMSALGILY